MLILQNHFCHPTDMLMLNIMMEKIKKILTAKAFRLDGKGKNLNRKCSVSVK